MPQQIDPRDVLARKDPRADRNAQNAKTQRVAAGAMIVLGMRRIELKMRRPASFRNGVLRSCLFCLSFAVVDTNQGAPAHVKIA